MPRIPNPRERRRIALAASFVMLGIALCMRPAAAESSGPEPLKPRAAFTVDGLEVVLVLAKDRLYAFVDGVDDNVPASVDRLSVETGKRQWDLIPAGPGLYVVAPFVLAPGHRPLTVNLTAGGNIERVETVLDIDKAAVVPVKSGTVLSWLWWIVAVVAGVALAVELGGWRFGARILRSPGGGA